ncbi:hypothetical protein B0T25DRAFT_453910 [Lasiosphaeria hispida]|uniref:Uncharacterized protein n=1 Tax=Lasiosphaeria hispida TaxID=260671 RepID=A0AAJ0HI36_9PEZI|nr:hypothetical protein B0T25DRAFT_453910 [Lasiosphaeria hispida]
MKSIAGRGAAAFPPQLPTLADLSPIITASPEHISLVPFSQIPWREGCTTTLAKDPKGGCLDWNGVETVHPSTTIKYKSIDCHGCDYFFSDDFRFCPNRQINATERVSTPSTYWSTVCQPTTALGYEPQADASALTTTSSLSITRTPVDTMAKDLAACPTTYVVQPEQSAGKTLTTYSRYTTTTVLLNCGGCPLVVSTALVGYGPPGVFTKTTTLPVGARTTYACR